MLETSSQGIWAVLIDIMYCADNKTHQEIRSQTLFIFDAPFDYKMQENFVQDFLEKKCVWWNIQYSI
jgi:hypothetical protein